MIEPKISIIVPVNNVEGFLPSCLDTLINQTFKDLEIICINDGSKDYSKQVLENYSKQDSRILVINENESKGQAFARNQGLKIARGEYIGFVDGDDWVELNMFEKLYENAKTYDTDITMCATHLHNEYTESSSHDSSYYNLSGFNDSFNNRSFTAQETTDLLLDINVAIWNKIYKKDFLEKINAKFKEGYIYEDLPFFFETYLKAERISLVRDFLYFYRTNRLGSTMSNLGVKVLDRIDMVSLTYEMFKALSYYDEIKIKIIGWIINDLFHRYTLVDKRYKKEFYFKMQKLFRNIEPVEDDFLKDFYCYEEFLLVKEYSYEECNSILFSKYKNSKKMVKEIEYFRDIQLAESIEKYESKLNELKYADKKLLEEQLKAQKDWYEKKLEIELENYKNSFEVQKQTELSSQKSYYEKEIQNGLEIQKKWFEGEIEKKLREVNDWHDKDLNQKLKEANSLYQNELGKKLKEADIWHKNELDEKLKEANSLHKNELDEKLKEANSLHQNELDEKLGAADFCHKNELKECQDTFFQELEEKLEGQSRFLEEDFNKRKEEIDNWHNNNLQEKLLEQKNNYEEQIQKLRLEYSDYINNQKISYEKEISHVKFALKVVKKLKNIKRKVINSFK